MIIYDDTTGARVYLRPLGFLAGAAAARAVAADAARWLAGGPVAFTHLEVLRRGQDAPCGEVLSLTDAQNRYGSLDPLTGLRSPLLLPSGARIDLSMPVIMGIVNVTPDSFSDGGDCFTPDAAIARGRAMMVDGARILDVGGESTRPGADPVDSAEEQQRILPVIKGLAGVRCPVSVDTRRADTMSAAMAAGAAMINDVSALTFDADSLSVAARSHAPVVLMHAQGDPRTMQKNPAYGNVLLDVFDYLEARVAAAEAAGVPRHQIIVDPGIGFGKGLAHNLALLDGIGLFHGIGCPVLLGVSRKSFIGRVSGEDDAKARVPGSLAVATLARAHGVQIFRVHDVAETAQALSLTEAVLTAGREGAMAHA